MIRLLLFLSLPLYILDQVTKGWVVRTFELNGEGRVVVPDFFMLHHVANTGIAFGQFNGGKYSNYIFGAVAVGALTLIAWLYRKGTFSGGFSRVAIALLVAGVCGNFTDRLLHGYVVDFLQFDLHVPLAHPWPSFNVADSCVVCAAFLLFFASFAEAPKPETEPK
jgi:signal peptidase II